MNAEKIRKWFHDLFGSRLVVHLETALLKQQSEYDQRLNEKDQIIVDLKSELQRLRGRFDELEMDPSYFWMLASRSKSKNAFSSFPDPIPDTSVSSWRKIQEDWNRQQEAEEIKEAENGRKEVHVEVPRVTVQS